MKDVSAVSEEDMEVLRKYTGMCSLEKWHDSDQRSPKGASGQTALDAASILNYGFDQFCNFIPWRTAISALSPAVT